ncbi:MAG: hypothetical protein HY828_08195 [Actinobacteria bacterium]|nr:hypothetical protein [Actinomycetota bacterium]
MERAAALDQPVGCSDGDLDSSPEPALGRTDGGVHLVAVRSSEYQEVDVAHWSIALLTGEPCRPGPVDVGGVDPADAGERLTEHPWNAERLDEHVRQPAEVRAGRVGADEPCSSDEPTRHETRGHRAFDLAVDGGIRDPGSLGELSQAVLDRRVAEDERQQLGLLL